MEKKFNSFAALKAIMPKEEKKVDTATKQRVRYYIDPRTGQFAKQVY